MDLTVPETTKGQLSISSNFETYTYIGLSDDYGVTFDLQKYNKHYTLAFDIRYYNADQGGDNYPDSDNCASGAYIFKPAKNDQ